MLQSYTPVISKLMGIMENAEDYTKEIENGNSSGPLSMSDRNCRVNPEPLFAAISQVQLSKMMRTWEMKVEA